MAIRAPDGANKNSIFSNKDITNTSEKILYLALVRTAGRLRVHGALEVECFSQIPGCKGVSHNIKSMFPSDFLLTG